MKCILISFFNSTNIGDLVLAKSLMEQVEKHGIEVVPVSYSQNIAKITDINNIPEKKRSSVMGWRHIAKTIFSVLGGKYIIYKGYEAKKYLDDMNEQKLEKLIETADFVIIGGGNMVFDIFDYSLSAARLNYFIQKIKKYNKKVCIFSVGIGPFKNKYQTEMCMEVLDQADFITFRDEKSKELFDTYCKRNEDKEKAKLSADPAFLLKKNNSQKKREYIAVNIINPQLIYNKKSDISKVENLYIDLINQLSKKYQVIVFGTEQMDYEYIDYLQNKCKFKKITIKGLKDLYDLYEITDFIIGSRMHSIIIGMTQEIPTYGLIWQTKVASLFQMFDMMKYSSNILNSNVDEIVEIVDSVCKNNHSYLKVLDKGLNTMRERLLVNDRYLDDIREE